MWKAAFAGVVALALGTSGAFAESEADFGRTRTVAKSEASLSLAQVARLKTVLKLNQAQEQFWPAVEHAFREISEAQEGGTSRGLLHGLKQRVASIGLNAIALRRLATAAYPLIRTLNDEQKQSAVAFARSIGLESVAAAF